MFIPHSSQRGLLNFNYILITPWFQWPEWNSHSLAWSACPCLLLSSHGWLLSWPPFSYGNKFSPDSLLLSRSLGCALPLPSLPPPSSPVPSYGGSSCRKGPVALLAKDRPPWLACAFTLGTKRIWVLWSFELIQFGTAFKEKEYMTSNKKLEKSKYLKKQFIIFL